jgi:signal transduction histidine kinase
MRCRGGAGLGRPQARGDDRDAGRTRHTRPRPEARLPLDDRAEEELFRVVQEAVHNSVKHAHPGCIEIRLEEESTLEGALIVEVVDDGVGFDPAVSHTGHLGINGMRERTERLGGRLIIDSSPTGSTTVRAVLPGILRPPGADRPVARHDPLGER